MPVNYLNKIISIFLQRGVNEISEKDLSATIEETNKLCSIEQIHRSLESNGLSLFEIQCSKEGMLIVHIEPKINICQKFCSGKCVQSWEGCNQLHICPNFGRCGKNDCHFPHNLFNEHNQSVIQQLNCQNIDPNLLVRLIQFHKRTSHPAVHKSRIIRPSVIKPTKTVSSSVQPKPVEQVSGGSNRRRPRRGRRPRNETSENVADQENFMQSPSVSSKPSTNDQIDMGFPSPYNTASNITIETIIAFLKSQGLVVHKYFDRKISEHFHQWTLQMEGNNVVDHILKRSVIPYKDLSLKFKRTNPIIDSKSFVLKSTIHPAKGPISREKFNTYVDKLVNSNAYKLTDLSTQSEQILLIECNKIIDFDRLRRVQRSRAQVQGADVSLIQIYEIDTAIIESLGAPLTFIDIQNILKSVYDNVFIFSIVSNHAAFIEFTHADALKQWLMDSGAIEWNFHINIKPSLKYVDEGNKNNVTIRSSASQMTKSKVNDINSRTTIYIRRTWALVAEHPKFSIEYKNYIRSETGFEIDIRGNRIQIRSTSTLDIPSNVPHSSLLSNRTRTFMENFLFHTISLQNSAEQRAILHAHSSTVAFCEKQPNTYLLAATSSNMEHIMQKLLPEKSVYNKPTNHACSAASTTQKTNKSVDQKYTSWDAFSPPFINTISTDDEYMTVTKTIALPINTPAQEALFNDKTVKNYLQIHFNQIYDTKIYIELKTNNNKSHTVEIVGCSSSVNKSLEELLRVVSLCRTKTFNDINDIPWIKMKDAIRVIQHQFDVYNIIYVCQLQTSPVSIQIHHIDKSHDELGVDEQIIELLCREQLILRTCKAITVGSEWTTLISDILERDDYSKDICLLDEQNIITLYGLPDAVKNVQQQFDKINQKAIEKLKSVPPVRRIVSVNSEKPRQSIIESLPKSTENTTPKPQTRSIVFDIDEPGFELLIDQDFPRLLAIVGSNCSIVKQILHHQIPIPIPKTKINETDDNTPAVQSEDQASRLSNDSNTASAETISNWFYRLFYNDKSEKPQSPVPSISAAANTTPSLTIGKSKINVCTGDLTKQAVDLVVCCSTSQVLCDAIISAAGSEIEKAYRRQSCNGVPEFEASGGNLPCKRIIFRPWLNQSKQRQDLKLSIDKFVTSIISYALQQSLKTIAFPSIGCGQLGHDPKIIAEHMIGETYRLLKISLQTPMEVSFVLLPDQKNVYDAFVNQLKMMSNVDDTPTSISFDKQTVRITLTGSDDRALIECQQKVKALAQSCSSKLHLTEKTDMVDWPQKTIQKYYEYCFQKRVLPTLDISNGILDLIGPKDAVVDAEKYYYQLTTETLRNARIQVISRGYVWSVEISSGKWEAYSTKAIEQIENAFTNRLPSVDIINEKSERCRLIFTNMEEEHQKRKRKIRRNRIDKLLPNNWDLSSHNSKRVILPTSCKEYTDVLNRFDTTMKNQYGIIVKIERIQNERWYKQYAVHRDDFIQRGQQPDERLLFHGCSSDSANKIIEKWFNRSFAGVNGTLYGGGVYFHEHAKYSHNYTRPNASSERKMFLARVLIGKTIIGNQSMIEPPEGYDTTTDGQHIFVVYHDAAAYGEYLITYK